MEECSKTVLINVISPLAIYNYGVSTPAHFFLFLGAFSPAQLKVGVGVHSFLGRITCRSSSIAHFSRSKEKDNGKIKSSILKLA